MPAKIPVPDGHAHCGKCKRILLKSKFDTNKSNPSGVASYCRGCRSRSASSESFRFDFRDLPEGHSRCNRCHEIKPRDQFKIKNTARGVHVWCNACDRSTIPFAFKEPTSIQAAYIAGLIEAEGTFILTNEKTRYAPTICIFNNDKSLLEDIEKMIGGSLRSVREGREHSLNFYNQKLCKALCVAILPYMVLKKRQCEIIIEACNRQPVDRVALRDEIKHLNRKEVRHEFPETETGKQVELSFIGSSDWAYLAGWLDGDGTITFQPQAAPLGKYHYPWIIVYNTKPGALLYLHKIFGGTIKTRNRTDRWALSGELKFSDQNYVKLIARGLLPYVISKKEHLQIVLDSMNHPAAERGEYAAKVSELNEPRRRKIDRSNIATVYSLSDYAKKDENGVGPKGVDYVIGGDDKSPPIKAKVYSLAECAALAGT